MYEKKIMTKYYLRRKLLKNVKWYLINTISDSLAFPWSIFDCLKVYWYLLTFWHQNYPGILGFKMTINFDMTHFSTQGTCKHWTTPSLMVDYIVRTNITMFQFFSHSCFFSKGLDFKLFLQYDIFLL